MAYEKPLPNVTREDGPFWQAAREHRFVLPRCTNCGHVFFPPYLSCPRCLSFELEWMEASGKGTVWGHTVMRHPYIPSFVDELPYNVVLVELDEGPMLYSNVVGIDHGDVRPDMRVEVVFEDATDEITLVKFRPTQD